MSYHVQSDQRKIFREILVFEILALHAKECSDLDELYIKIGKNNSKDSKIILTMKGIYKQLYVFQV